LEDNLKNVVKGSGSETVDSVQVGSKECLTVSNRDNMHVTGIIVYIKQTSFRRVRKIAKGDYQLRHICLPFFFSVSLCVCLSVRPSACASLRPTGRIVTKL